MKRAPADRHFIMPGFTFAGMASGIKRSGERDLALIYSGKPAVIAGLFTTSRIKAAPVKLAIKNIASHKARAIIVNSGNANACTGTGGMKDAREIQRKTAEELGIPPEQVYVSSTGIIGRRLPMEKIRRAIPALVGKLSPSSMSDTASAILTTDRFAKVASKKNQNREENRDHRGNCKGRGYDLP